MVVVFDECITHKWMFVSNTALTLVVCFFALTLECSIMYIVYCNIPVLEISLFSMLYCFGPLSKIFVLYIPAF